MFVTKIFCFDTPAFNNSTIEIVEKSSSKVISQEDVIVGKNEFTFTLEDKKDYVANIYIDYDLFSGKN